MVQRYRYRQGGLMRCCIQTLAMAYDPGEPSVDEVEGVEGAKLSCLYCSGSMIFKDGAWEWDFPRDDMPPSPPLYRLAD